MLREIERNLGAMTIPKREFYKYYKGDMWKVFDTLSFKERQILGGYFGVFGHKKRTLTDIGEDFCFKENSARKAKDKAPEKLRLYVRADILAIGYRSILRLRILGRNGPVTRVICGMNRSPAI